MGILAVSSTSIVNVNDGSQGPQGVGITAEKEQWYLSSSNSSLSGGSWSYTEPDEIPTGKYLWGRIEFTMSNGTKQYSDAVHRSTISGVISKVDNVAGQITNKVWQTDIDSKINTYDGTTGESIRDRVAETETDIEGIRQSISALNTEVDQKADESTVTSLSSRVSAVEDTATQHSQKFTALDEVIVNKADQSDVTALNNRVSEVIQDANGFKQTVEATYTKKADFDALKIGTRNYIDNSDMVNLEEVPYTSSTAIKNESYEKDGYVSYNLNTSQKIIVDFPDDITVGKQYIFSFDWCRKWTPFDLVTKIGDKTTTTTTINDENWHREIIKFTASSETTNAEIYINKAESKTIFIRHFQLEEGTLESDWHPSENDMKNYTDSQVSSARSEFVQTAEGIRSTVEDGNHLVSVINQTADSVQIDASKINLIGAVTVSMLDEETKKSITGEVIVGTQTTSTSAWTGKSTTIEALDIGTTIAYKLPYASTSTAVSLNLTLKDGKTTTGAKPVYYQSTTRVTTQYGVNSIVQLIYDGSAWRVLNPYTDSYDRTRYNVAITAGNTPLTNGNIIVATGTDGTYSNLKTSGSFDIAYPILYTASTVNANATTTNTYLAIAMNLTNTQSGPYIANKNVYIKGTLSGTRFTPVTGAFLTQTIPTQADSYQYILLGMAYSTTNIYLAPDHPIYMFHDGSFKTTTQIAAEASQTAILASQSAETANQTLAKIGVYNIVTEYGTSSSPTTQPTSWSSSVPTWSEGTYIWQKTTTTNSNEQQVTDIVCLTGHKGETGASGGDAYTIILTNESHTFAGGISSAIASSATCNVIGYKGTSQVAVHIGTISGLPQKGMSTSISNNDTANASFKVTVTDQMVTRQGSLTIPVTIDGKTFNKTFSYALALKGETGSSGTNSATIYLYQRATSTPAVPTGSLTYTFSTGKLTASTALGSWTQDIPSGTNPCYITVATATSADEIDTIDKSEWSTPIQFVVNGADGAKGYNQATLYLYKRATSKPSKPSAITYTFSNGSWSAPSGWNKNIPTTTGEPCWVSTVAAISQSPSVSVSAWSDPTKMVEDSTTYSLLSSHNAITLSNNGQTYSPTSITFTAKSQTGNNEMKDYAGRFKIETTTDNSTWTEITSLTSTSDEATKTYPISGSIAGVKCSLYLAGDTTTLVDQQTIPIISNGIGISSVVQYYAISSGGIPNRTPLQDLSGRLWKITPPDYIAGVKYYTCNVITYTNGNKTNTDIIEHKGLNAAIQTADTAKTTADSVQSTVSNINIYNIVTQYGTSTSASTQPTDDEWQSAVPAWSEGTYIWQKTITTDKNGTENVDIVCLTGHKGATGGDAYTVILTNESHTFPGNTSGAIASSTECGVIGYKGATQVAVSFGTISNLPSGMTITPSGSGTNKKLTIAVTASLASTSGTVTIPVIIDNKTFNKTFSYSVALKGTPGAPGTPGLSGSNTATVYLYKRASSKPGKPTGASTYTFSTGKLTENTTNALNGWTQNFPDGTDPCYVIVATATSVEATDTINASEWSDQVKLVSDGKDGKDGKDGQNGQNGQDGAKGYNQATLYLYQRATSSPSKPSSSFTYTFSNGNWSAVPANWSKTIPNTNGKPCWVTTAAILGQDDSISVASSSWSTPAKLVEDATTYSLLVSHNAIQLSDDGSTYSPTSITFTAKSQTGNNAMANYSGRFKIETTTNNVDWTEATDYTSTSNESTKTYDLPADSKISGVRCSLYLAGGTTTLLDQQTIPIISNGISISSVTQYYCLQISKPTETPLENDSIWSTSPQSQTAVNLSNKYWTCTVVTYSDSSTSVTPIVEQAALNYAISTAYTAKANSEKATDIATAQLGMKINYNSFSNEFTGCFYLHGYNQNLPADTAGYIYWNGRKISVQKYCFNPYVAVPNFSTAYIVGKLSDSTATALANTAIYAVWYNGDKMHTLGEMWNSIQLRKTSGSATTWSWDEDCHIILGQFVLVPDLKNSTSKKQMIDAYLYDTPLHASNIMSKGDNSFQYSQVAVDWVKDNGENQMNAYEMLQFWTDNAMNKETKIQGGYIDTYTIKTENLATDIIMSLGYEPSANLNSPYSAIGSFLNLEDGNFRTPNFAVINSTPNGTQIPIGAYFNGDITARSGKIGSDYTYWNIESVYDYNATEHASLVAVSNIEDGQNVGSPYIQTGNWQMSDNYIATRKYVNGNGSVNKATYLERKENNSTKTTYYDFGMKVPTSFTVGQNDTWAEKFNRAIYYGRKYTEGTAGAGPSQLDNSWTYLFMIDSQGVIYAQDVNISNITIQGGTINGDLTVTGTLNATATAANTANTANSATTATTASKVAHSLTLFGNSYNGSSAVSISTVDVAHGGTGKTTLTSGQVLIGNGTGAVNTRAIKNNTSASHLGWTSATNDTMLITSNTLAYWDGRYKDGYSNLEYVKAGKLGTVVTHDVEEFITSSGGVVDGSLSVTDLTAGSLLVNGSGRFIDGIYGDVTGNVTGNVTGTATYSTAVKDSGNNNNITISNTTVSSASYFAAWNGYNIRAISADNLRSSINAMYAIKYTSTTAPSTSADTYVDFGLYEMAFSHTGESSWPSANNGDLFVSNLGTKYQIYIPDTTMEIYKRKYDNTNNQFLAWSKIWDIGATYDGNGDTISSTYLKLTGGTVNGDLEINKTTSISNNLPAKLIFTVMQTNNNVTSQGYIAAYDKHSQYSGGANMVIQSSGNMYIGSGSSPQSLYNAIGKNSNINHCYITSDKNMFLESGAETLQNRVGMVITQNHSIVPVKAETFSTNIGSIGTSAYKWANVYATTLHGKLDSRKITIGNTGKNVDWSANVTWTKEEISGTASSSSDGWMSSTDKAKLDGISISKITDVISATTITGSNGISVTFNEQTGQATVKHSNTQITGGTTSNTTGAVNFGGSISIPQISYDAFGHITGVTSSSVTLPSLPSNIGTADKFSSAKTIALTGDTTGSKSSDGSSGWSISTTTAQISATSLSKKDLNDYKVTEKLRVYYGGGGNQCTNNPVGDNNVFGLITYPGAASFVVQELANGASKFIRYWDGTNGVWNAWQRFITDTNYTSYTVKKDGTGATGTWGINISGNAASISGTLPVNKGGTGATTLTANAILSGNGTNAINSYASVQTITGTNQAYQIGETNVTRNGLYIAGTTYGNVATALNSGELGVMSFGDGGPQIVFGTTTSGMTGQMGSLLFTDHDKAGSGVSWHFVSNQSDWSVNSKRFVAKTSVTIGQNVPNTSANLYVDGSATVTGPIYNTSTTISRFDAGIRVNNSKSDAGGISLYNTNIENYGIMFRTTSTQVKHGSVQGDWATYFTMTGGSVPNTENRGWIFMNTYSTKHGVASISGAGNASFNGKVAIGTDGTNINGSCSLEMDREHGCLNFVFN